MAATLLIRFATLWFAVILGGIALALLQRGIRNGTARATGRGVEPMVGEAT